MSERTVNVPGGPAYVFGAKNLAYTGPQSAGGSVDADPRSALSDFGDMETVSSDNSDAKIRPDGTVDFSALQKTDRVEAMQAELIEGMTNLAVDKEQFNAYIDFARSGYNYSFRNQVLLAMQKPGGSNFKTYKQWSALGYQVQKGSESASILRPVIRKEDREDKDGNVIIGDDGKPMKQERLVGYASYGVFSENDLDPSVKEPPTHPLNDHIRRYRHSEDISDNQAMREDLTRVAESMGIPVQMETPETDPSLTPDTGGYAQKTADGGYRIVLNSSVKEHSQTYTMAHEMAHVLCGHLDSSETRNYGLHDERGSIEVEAETVAYAISRDYGLETGNRAFAYLAGWSQGDENKISETMGNVSKGLRSYYEKLEKSVTGTNRNEENATANAATKEASTARRAAKKKTSRRKK